MDGTVSPIILYEKRIELKLSSSEVYHMNSLILLTKNMLCNKLHCQKANSLISLVNIMLCSKLHCQ